jgi:hypothetical protein
MTDVKLAGKLPPGEANGIAPIGPEMAEHPGRLRVVLAIVDCQEVRLNTITGDTVTYARVRRIEVALARDLGTAEQLMRRALEARSGQTVLPMELEDELRSAFADFDPDADDDQGDEAGEAGELWSRWRWPTT